MQYVKQEGGLNGTLSTELVGSAKERGGQWAASQGVSLNQSIMWSVADKVGVPRHSLNGPDFPQFTYRRGTAGVPTPVLRGTALRIQTIVVAAQQWQLTTEQVAAEYELAETQVKVALAFCEAHCAEIDAALDAEQRLEEASV